MCSSLCSCICMSNEYACDSLWRWSRRYGSPQCNGVLDCTVVCSTVYGGVLHYRWSGVAPQTKVHLSQGGSWHAFHKLFQDLATRNDTWADFPFRSFLWGSVNFSRDLKHDRMLLCTIQKTWKANEPEKHGKTIKRRRHATLENLQTWKWICAGAHSFPHKKCWLKCLLVRWLFWPCRSFLSRFCNDLRSASFVCVFLATATYFIVWSLL